MPSFRQIFLFAPALLAVAHAQGVITSAQGEDGSPASLPLQVDLTKPDANIMKVSEIEANVVNECGRTLLAGNIDIGANTEDQLANGTVTSVTKGGKLAVTIAKVNNDGAGPYTCNTDLTNNADGSSGQTNLTMQETDKGNTINLDITMPDDLACIGSSPGNVCTVRCFNQQGFGGCVAVQQTDTTPHNNTVENIETAAPLKEVEAQVLVDNKNLPAAVKAIAEAHTGTQAEQGVDSINEMLSIDSTAAATAGIPVASGSSNKKRAVAARRGVKTFVA